jgi:hypothetical protein
MDVIMALSIPRLDSLTLLAIQALEIRIQLLHLNYYIRKLIIHMLYMAALMVYMYSLLQQVLLQRLMADI